MKNISRIELEECLKSSSPLLKYEETMIKYIDNCIGLKAYEVIRETLGPIQEIILEEEK